MQVFDGKVNAKQMENLFPSLQSTDTTTTATATSISTATSTCRHVRQNGKVEMETVAVCRLSFVVAVCRVSVQLCQADQLQVQLQLQLQLRLRLQLQLQSAVPLTGQFVRDCRR